MPAPKSFNSEDSFGTNMATDEQKDQKMDDENVLKEEVELSTEEAKPLTKEEKIIGSNWIWPSDVSKSVGFSWSDRYCFFF